MNLPLTLAGNRAAWRFRDSRLLDAWLSETPWIDRNELRVVRIREALAEDVLLGLRRAVLAADEQRSGVRVEILDRKQAAASAERAVCELLELPASMSRPAALQVAANRLLGPPTVFLVPPVAPGPSLFADTQHWLGQLGKLGGRATILMTDTPSARLAPQAFDFSVGLPADGLFADETATEAAWWRSYGHRRLAWESAGDPAWARGADESVATVPPTDEDALEALFNRLAREAWAALETRRRLEVGEHLRHLLRRSRTRDWLDRRERELEQTGLYWRSPGEDRRRPAPWAARAMLLANEIPEGTMLLRGCLVCAPLARELLSRCFDLEADFRAIGWAKEGGATVPPALRERFDRQHRPESFTARLYPAGSPAVPDDPWAVADFHEFLDALGDDDPHYRPLHQLRKLRNFLAHGHYVSWAVIVCLRDVERRLQR